MLRRTTLLLIVVGVLAPTAALADRFEASVAGELHGGVARVGQAGADPTTTPMLGASLRVTHAWHNALAWDLQLGGAVTQPATFDDTTIVFAGRPEHGEVTRRSVTADAQVGGELRLGAGLMPTVRLGLGPQLRYRSGSDLGVLADVIPATTSLDAVVSLAVGFDLRLGRHLVVGFALQLDHAQPISDAAAHDVIGATLRVSRFWYPRWWGPSW